MAQLPAVKRIETAVRKIAKEIIAEETKAFAQEASDFEKRVTSRVTSQLDEDLTSIVEEALGLGVTPSTKKTTTRGKAVTASATLRMSKGKRVTKKVIAKKTKKSSSKRPTASKASTKTKAKAAARSKSYEQLKKELIAKKKPRAAVRRKVTAKPATTEATCGIIGCEGAVRSKGYCGKDYQNARNNGWDMPCPPNFDPPRRKRGRPKQANGESRAQA